MTTAGSTASSQPSSYPGRQPTQEAAGYRKPGLQVSCRITQYPDQLPTMPAHCLLRHVPASPHFAKLLAASPVNPLEDRPRTVLHPPPVGPFWLPDLSDLVLQCNATTTSMPHQLIIEKLVGRATEAECDAQGTAMAISRANTTKASNCVCCCRSKKIEPVIDQHTLLATDIVSSSRGQPMLQACFVVGYMLAATQGSSSVRCNPWHSHLSCTPQSPGTEPYSRP
jgi:hypothetical protein